MFARFVCNPGAPRRPNPKSEIPEIRKRGKKEGKSDLGFGLAGTMSSDRGCIFAIDCRSFLEMKEVDHELKKDIVLAMEEMHTQKDTLVPKEKEILDRLPPFYRKLVTQDLYHSQIKSCPLFAKTGQQVIFRLAAVLEPYLGLEGDKIIQQGHLGDGMFLLSKGQVTIDVKDPHHVAEELQDEGKHPIHAVRMHGMVRDWTCAQFRLLCVRFDSHSAINVRQVFCDGAFFGELPVLGLGNGWLRNQHMCVSSRFHHVFSCFLTFASRFLSQLHCGGAVEGDAYVHLKA